MAMSSEFCAKIVPLHLVTFCHAFDLSQRRRDGNVGAV